jgi:hypothetical protein
MNITPNQIPDNATLVSFIYTKPAKDGKVSASRRFIRMGKEATIPLLRGGESWGKSNTGNRFVSSHKHDTQKRREYLQGVEEQEDGRLQIKRFDFLNISNLEILETC